MVLITIKDEISGKPVVIVNPLSAEHIKVNQLLWYEGFTSTSGWNCPAIIVRVNRKKKLFKIRSLDDMRIQDQWYSFDREKDGSGSRQTMRLITTKDAEIYLNQRRKVLESKVDNARKSLALANDDLEAFDNTRATLHL